MPRFEYGIDAEATIYCTSSYRGLSMDPQANGVINHLKQVVQQDGKVDLPMNDISDFIVLFCQKNVLIQNDNVKDEKGVAWRFELLAKAFIVASSIPCSYDTLFKECFKKYYKDFAGGARSTSDTLPGDAVEELELTLDMVYYFQVAMVKQRLNTVDFLKAAYPLLNQMDQQGKYSRRAIAQAMVNYFNSKLSPKQGASWVNMLAENMARFRTFEQLQSVLHIPEY